MVETDGKIPTEHIGKTAKTARKETPVWRTSRIRLFANAHHRSRGHGHSKSARCHHKRQLTRMLTIGKRHTALHSSYNYYLSS
jgi:hypothetical protein